LRHDEPVRISYDNKTLQTSLFFLGNSTYLPSGFAPSRRTRMDDGLMDVRILETGRRFSRLRIVSALALGRLTRSPLYHEMRGPGVRIRRRRRVHRTGTRRRDRNRVRRGHIHRELPGTGGVSSAAVIGATGGTRSRQTTTHAYPRAQPASTSETWCTMSTTRPM